VVRVKQAVDLHTSTLDQLIVADVLADEVFLATHLDRLRAVYGRRSRALVAALAGVGGGRFTVDPPAGGMFVWAGLAPALGLTADALLPAALDAGVAFVPGSAFLVDPADAATARAAAPAGAARGSHRSAVAPSAVSATLAATASSPTSSREGDAERGDGQPRLRLCFATLDEDGLAEAVGRLVAAVDRAVA
jgi:DNA-binding transcriptional MocR family regulator